MPYYPPASGGGSTSTVPTTGTGTMPTGSTTDTIAHGLGKTPTFIRITCLGTMSSNTNSATYSYSVGNWSAAGNKCMYNQGGINTTSASQTSASFAAFGADPATPASNNSTGTIQNVGGTNFEIAWGASGSIGATAVRYFWEAYAF